MERREKLSLRLLHPLAIHSPSERQLLLLSGLGSFRQIVAMPALDLRLSGWRPIRHGLKQHVKRLRHSDRIRIGNLFINDMRLGLRMTPSSILARHTGRILAEDPAGKCALRNARNSLIRLDKHTTCVYYVDVR